MAKTFIISDEVITAYGIVGIDPEQDLAARVKSIMGSARRKQETDLAPYVKKMTYMTDVELTAVKTTIDTAVKDKLPVEVSPAVEVSPVSAIIG